MEQQHQSTSTTTVPQQQLVLRMGRQTMAFATADAASRTISYEQLDDSSNISMAARLRNAFETVGLLQPDYRQGVALLGGPVLLVPIDEYHEQEAETLFRYAITGNEGEQVMSCVVPEFSVVALFAMSRDLHQVLADHFGQLRLLPQSLPVWQLLHRRHAGSRVPQLFGYLHDGQIEVMAFRQNRFSFFNVFDAVRRADTLYFLLHTWQLLGLDADEAELHLLGDDSEADWYVEQLRAYLGHVFFDTTAACLNRLPATVQGQVPLDVLALLDV